MSEAAAFASGKGHRDENFPVASLLIAPRLRPPIMAFYRFARAADDIADNASAPAEDKLRALEQMRAALAGEAADEPTAVALREALSARDLSVQHGLDLLVAFRRDVTQDRYADWDELMDYCRWSAAPVGRMVLDIHGAARSTWPASDALCAALQVINHLQDCAKDRRELDRVYLPESDLAAEGAQIADLDRPAASPALRAAIATMARRTQGLLDQARPLAGQVADFRLRAEIAFIQAVAEDLTARLARRDPLSERVHHRKLELLGPAFTTLLRLARPKKPLDPVPLDRAEMTP
jgi:squalene synthase HpnC